VTTLASPFNTPLIQELPPANRWCRQHRMLSDPQPIVE
jgi:hypothetical protein